MRRRTAPRHQSGATLDSLTLAAVAIAFLLAGGVKGVIGVGLPLTAIAVLSIVLELRQAVPLLIVPLLVTNFWQMVQGGAFVALFRRFWAMNLASGVGIWVGTGLLYSTDAQVYSAILGAVICIYSAINLFSVVIRLPARGESAVAPSVGFISGILGGTTGSVGVPLIVYLQAIGLARDVFVQAISLSFFTTALVWVAALIVQGALDAATATISAAAIVPAVLGMLAGQWARHRASQDRFRTLVFLFLFVTGANLVRKGLF